MKRILVLFLVFLFVKTTTFAQEQSVLLGRLDFSHQDHFSGFITVTTISFAGDLRYENHTLSLSAGPLLNKWNDDKIRLSFMPTVAYDESHGQTFAGLKLLYKTADLGGIEALINGSYLRSLNKDATARYAFDGEITRIFSEKFNIGICLGAEQEKIRTRINTVQTMLYNDKFHSELRFNYKPKFMGKFSLNVFAGFVYQNHVAKDQVFAYDLGNETKPNVGMGLKLALF